MFKPHLDQLGGAQGPSSQGGPQRHLATISCATGATAGLFTEPQTAAGVVSFLQIRPINVFFKQFFFLLHYILLQLFSQGFHAPFLK